MSLNITAYRIQARTRKTVSLSLKTFEVRIRITEILKSKAHSLVSPANIPKSHDPHTGKGTVSIKSPLNLKQMCD